MTNPTEMQVLGRWTQQVQRANGAKLEAAKASMGLGLEDIKKGFTPGKVGEGMRGVAFGRTAGVGVGLAVAGDALFRGKTADGEDRGMLARMGEATLGLGMAAGSLIVGRGR